MTIAAQRETSVAPAARVLSWAGPGLLAAVAAAGALAYDQALAAGPGLLVMAALLGLPHGAVDHLALGWARGRTGSAPAAVLVGYAGSAIAVAAVAVAAPVPAVVVLLALSVAHFAEGEAAFDRLRGRAGLALPAAATGLLVVTGPVLLRPGQVRSVLAGLDPGLPAALDGPRLPVLAVTAVLVVAGLVTAVRAGERQAALELGVLTLAVLLAPPLLVFAAWFAGWHSPRHLVRLAALEPDGDGRTRARRLARGAVAPTLVAVAGLGALVLLLGGLPGAVLLVLLALTVPHAAVVARLDALAVGRISARGTPAGPSG